MAENVHAACGYVLGSMGCESVCGNRPADTSAGKLDLIRTERHDWKAEASGLALMILNIRDNYRFAQRSLGGDSEFLAGSIHQAAAYVDGPMRELFDGPRRQEAHP